MLETQHLNSRQALALLKAEETCALQPLSQGA